ncbi:MAG TPA: fumarate hydratase [Candidatus Omnitrophica bacterium]|nr:fumarate hydratase [Candidatus Omnitrophota bacterium]
MKKLTEKMISESVARLCIDANLHLRPDVDSALARALSKESGIQAKKILKQLVDNARIAKADRVALCQDTGMPVVFVDIGRGVDVSSLDMTRAVNKGVREGYKRGYLRNSIVLDPLAREGASKFSPCVIHFTFGRHKGMRITVLPKGFGCENKTQLKMFNPTATIGDIKDFIISAVQQAGPDACPPYILGIGIGGTADYACQLSKEALLRPIDKPNPLGAVAKLEKELYKKINQSGIGPMGLGGNTTVLGVNIKTFPTHIAGLPVCVNISCHVLRSASVIL